MEPSLNFRRRFAMVWIATFGRTVTCGSHRYFFSPSQGNVGAGGFVRFWETRTVRGARTDLICKIAQGFCRPRRQFPIVFRPDELIPLTS
jgi:hypothetical protein